MKIASIDVAIDKCRNHLDATGAYGSEIESYLTRYLLIFICATIETEIKKLAVDRGARSGDIAVTAFFESAAGQLFRRFKTSDIADSLGRFGLNYKRDFQYQMSQNPKAETFFNNIVTNRHDTAHQSGSNITFRELVEFYDQGHIVLDAIQKVLQS